MSSFNSKYQNVPYPSASSVEADFTKYFEVCDDEYEVITKLAQESEKELDQSLAKFINLIKDIASIEIRSKNGEYILHPNIIWEGKRSFMPEDLDDDDVAFLKQILPIIQPNLLQAKTAESLWAKTKRREYAYEAEMAYLRLVQEKNEWYKLAEYWGRLLYIDKKIKGGKESELKKIAFDFISENSTEVFSVLWFCVNLFKEKDFDAALLNAVVSKLKPYFSRIGLFDNEDIKPTLELIRRVDKIKADELTVTIVESFVKTAEFDAKSSAMKAAYSYDSAIKYVQLISDKKAYDVEDRKETYSRRCREIRKASIKEMSRFSEEIDLGDDVKNTENYFDKIGNKWTALLALASLVNFSIDNLKHWEKIVRDIIHKSIYLFLCGQINIVDSYGKVISFVEGVRPDKPLEEQNVFKQFRAMYFRDLKMEMRATFLYVAMKCIQKKFDYTEEELISMIRTNTNVPQSHLYAFAHGFYLTLKGDVFAAIHILTPAFEAFIRELFEKNKWKNTYMKDSKDQFLVLGSMIEKCEPFIKKYGESYHFHIYTVFCDTCGANLRNDIAHGLFVPTQKTLSLSLYAIALILNFLLYDKLLDKSVNSNND